ncbi:MAG: hypothetical protein M1335_06050 [Chloroflexi bacterium]|nr:hypothetical protein [Chloroflexota bacterium]
MKAERCSICSKESRAPWLFNLAKYDSLDENLRMRFTICEECARKLMAAMKLIIKEEGSGAIMGGIGRHAGDASAAPTLTCPICKTERETTEPQIPAPCERCGTIFSIYSAAGKK